MKESNELDPEVKFTGSHGWSSRAKEIQVSVSWSSIMGFRASIYESERGMVLSLPASCPFLFSLGQGQSPTSENPTTVASAHSWVRPWHPSRKGDARTRWCGGWTWQAKESLLQGRSSDRLGREQWCGWNVTGTTLNLVYNLGNKWRPRICLHSRGELEICGHLQLSECVIPSGTAK